MRSGDRSTGASGWRVGLLFTLVPASRSPASFGYAVGLCYQVGATSRCPSGSQSRSISLSPATRYCRRGVAGVGVPMGLVAGALAADPAALVHRPLSEPPYSVGQSGQSTLATLRSWVTPTCLSWRSVVPTAATLTVFGITFLRLSRWPASPPRLAVKRAALGPSPKPARPTR